MSKPRPLSGIEVTEKLVAEAEARRLAALSEEELREEMLDVGLDPDQPIDIDKWMTPVKTPAARAEPEGSEAKPAGPAEGSARPAGDAKSARVISLRRPAVVWSAITAVAACVFGLIIARSVLEHAHGVDTQATHVDAAPLPTTTSSGPSILVRAAQLRDEAQRACDEELWSACAQRLDAARALDPAGEHEARVEAMRQASAKGLWLRDHPAPDSTLPLDSKPGLPRPRPKP